MAITGNATYYELCLGGDSDTGTGGACGNCNDGLRHMAWPNLSSACDRDCGTNPRKGCSTLLAVKNKCNSWIQWIAIKDCYWGAQNDCTKTPRCNGSNYSSSSYQRPIVDLTTGAFLALGGNLSDGRIPVEVTV